MFFCPKDMEDLISPILSKSHNVILRGAAMYQEVNFLITVLSSIDSTQAVLVMGQLNCHIVDNKFSTVCHLKCHLVG